MQTREGGLGGLELNVRSGGHGKYFPITTFRRLIAHTRLTLSFFFSQIRAVRHNKIQAGLRSLDENALKGVKLTNMSAMEVSVIRPFMSNALDNFLEGSITAE